MYQGNLKLGRQERTKSSSIKETANLYTRQSKKKPDTDSLAWFNRDNFQILIFLQKYISMNHTTRPS